MNYDEVDYKKFMKQVDEFEKRNGTYPNKFPMSTEENEAQLDDIKEMVDHLKNIEKEYYDVYAKEMDKKFGHIEINQSKETQEEKYQNFE